MKKSRRKVYEVRVPILSLGDDSMCNILSKENVFLMEILIEFFHVLQLPRSKKDQSSDE